MSLGSCFLSVVSGAHPSETRFSFPSSACVVLDIPLTSGTTHILSENSIPAQKQPIQSRSVHFLEITFFVADSPPLFFQVIVLKKFHLEPNQKLN
uniref:Putative beta-1 3-galactosyltransferase 2 isoform X1 n=1 Tax=Rhizophora mucronata TaxID=61149 RepID=A0A2P2KLW6_RHIMU